ncbi:MerR family DNA-binding transcriptional regulator [Anaerofustis stercorihominis]|uniref:MerR family DNA-binding transcriptional regulator n=1 Tax=Anaerofustis stercorihominis TaxID=214853 RepID=UPI0027D45E1D|nr:MerR family DNA-binding transcriptional regulator [Anaerofustis stercorihominis]
MRTVKEVADLTGVSVRTLQYYDEIGVFKPTKVTKAGYRLYDDEALSTLLTDFSVYLINLKKEKRI